jgi:AcrR family transcriptional regulator
MARQTLFPKRMFLDAAASLVVSGGPAAATTLAILRSTGAPAGSLYHRFASRDALLAELWLSLAEGYQRQFLGLLEAGDALEAALYTPRWVRRHGREARILLLHRREDFVEKQWPDDFIQRAAHLGDELKQGLRAFTRRCFGDCSAARLRRVQFALIDVPLASVRRHLAAGEPIPAVADDLVRECCQALLAGGKEPTHE